MLRVPPSRLPAAHSSAATLVRGVLQIYQGTQRTDALVPVVMRVRILDAKGTALRDQSLPFPESSFASRRTDCVITLPLATLTPGDTTPQAGRVVQSAHERPRPAIQGGVSDESTPRLFQQVASSFGLPRKFAKRVP